MNHEKYDFRTAYIDLLLNVLASILFVFVIATVLISSKKNENEGIKKDAQYIINIAWPTKLNCDVDLWVKGPNDSIVYFQHLDDGYMHLERDDQGWWNDLLTVGNIVPDTPNEETWVLRGKLAGDYTANLHLYSCKIDEAQLKLNDPIDVPVEFELVQLNPKIKKIYNTKVMLTHVWEEKTVANFTINSLNNVDNPITTDFHKLVKDQTHG